MKIKSLSRMAKVVSLAVSLLIVNGPVSGDQLNNSRDTGAETGRRYDQTAEQGAGSTDRGRPRQPPQEAIDACSGKSNGEKVEFETPHGETVSGTCVKHGDLVFAVPEGGPPPQRGGARQQRRNQVGNH